MYCITTDKKIDRRTAGKATEAAKQLVETAIALGLFNPLDACEFLETATSASFSELAMVVDAAQKDNREKHTV